MTHKPRPRRPLLPTPMSLMVAATLALGTLGCSQDNIERLITGLARALVTFLLILLGMALLGLALLGFEVYLLIRNINRPSAWTWLLGYALGGLHVLLAVAGTITALAPSSNMTVGKDPVMAMVEMFIFVTFCAGWGGLLIWTAHRGRIRLANAFLDDEGDDEPL